MFEILDVGDESHRQFVTSEENARSEGERSGGRAKTHAHDARSAHHTYFTVSMMTSGTSNENDTPVDPAASRMGISSLPLDVISTHVLKSDFLPEIADLGRLRAVSKGMRDAVDATGREIKKLLDYEAADLGYVSLLKDRHRRGVLRDKTFLCAAAARKGDLEELKALRADEWPWNERTCTWAARGGHLEVLKWARANNCPWSESTCTSAARGGQLEVLKWARANDCPWDEWTCANAAEGGQLEVLKWARANDCPWDEHTRELAAAKGYVET